jgi:glycosyltransferase involved in cell wall biosynthesis
MNIKSYITKILLRLTYFGKGFIYRSRHPRKKALLSYVLVPHPDLALDFFYRQLHNRFLMCKLMIQSLNRLGYDVHLYDYLNTTVNYSNNYDVFIGHNKFFSRIGERLNSNCKKVLLTTGCSVEFDNRQLKQRNEDLKKRRRTEDDFYTPIAEEGFAKENCSTADHIFMIGSDFIRDNGWYPSAREKTTLYNNVTVLTPVVKRSRTGGFIFMSSQGQLRRGLDLILEAFAERSEKIFICGPYGQEPNFVKHFKKELSQTNNIKALGFVDQNSAEFKAILNEVDFAILPSCSEGQSGSLLTLMTYGMIPIAPDHTGFQNLDSLGIRMENFTVSEVHRCVERANAFSLEEMTEKRNRIYQTVLADFKPESFCRTFENFISRID